MATPKQLMAARSQALKDIIEQVKEGGGTCPPVRIDIELAADGLADYRLHRDGSWDDEQWETEQGKRRAQVRQLIAQVMRQSKGMDEPEAKGNTFGNI